MLLRHFCGEAAATVDADPDQVFASLTDVAHLPSWNQRISKVIDAPSRPLSEGTEWTVEMAVPPAKWVSRARVLTYDTARRCFRHRSSSGDGNPTYVDWGWTVTPVDAGCRVNVRWDAHVKTFWRQLLFAKLRRRQLVDEVSASLDALVYHIADR